ncbi:uncharacterized protein A4U43_C06F12610 [Asparagus officinalis]|uniref:Uncharacterized protein n=1 Tax=Asparagus officinalis TaxID=4686 RepID=A0A5P1EMF9_ASPOF|nr:uncharacterized protein A4U43_C06F12610 [Asparagus officinalis]
MVWDGEICAWIPSPCLPLHGQVDLLYAIIRDKSPKTVGVVDKINIFRPDRIFKDLGDSEKIDVSDVLAELKQTAEKEEERYAEPNNKLKDQSTLDSGMFNVQKEKDKIEEFHISEERIDVFQSKENDSDREVVVEKSLLSSVVLEEDTATKEDDKDLFDLPIVGFCSF